MVISKPASANSPFTSALALIQRIDLAQSRGRRRDRRRDRDGPGDSVNDAVREGALLPLVKIGVAVRGEQAGALRRAHGQLDDG